MKIHPCYYAGDLMPWASAIVSGNLVFLSGSEGRDPNRKQEYPSGREPKRSPVVRGVEAQTELTLSKIQARLEQLGLSLANIIVINYYVPKRKNWPKVWKTVKRFAERHCPDLVERPRAGTLLTEIGLDRPGMEVEIEVIAEVSPK
jgi:enamine deaminase RidA (YjgF/YER057c/UK114 family)